MILFSALFLCVSVVFHSPQLGKYLVASKRKYLVSLFYPAKISAGYFKCLGYLCMVRGCAVRPTRYQPPGEAAGDLAEHFMILKLIVDAYVRHLFTFWVGVDIWTSIWQCFKGVSQRELWSYAHVQPSIQQ